MSNRLVEGPQYSKRVSTAIQRVKERDINDLVKEVIGFFTKRYPHPPSIRDRMFELFWVTLDIPPSAFYENDELEVIRAKVEALVDLKLEKHVEGTAELESSGREAEESLVGVDVRTKPRIEQIVKRLKGTSVEKLVEEVTDFVAKKYPEVSTRYDVPSEVFTLFWASHEIPPSVFHYDEELELIRAQVEAAVRLRLKCAMFGEVKEKSVEQLADELVAFIEKEFPEAKTSPRMLDEARQLFWVSKGLRSTYVDDPQVRIKIQRTEFLAKEKWRFGEGKVASDFAEKSEEELANELVEFMKKEFPGEEQRISYRATGLFWQSKGVETHAFPRDPKVELKVEKVERLTRLKLEQETQKREKEVVPKLVDECVKWAKENGLRKVTKANVDYFLTERNQTLSKLSRDAIYNKVNLILAK